MSRLPCAEWDAVLSEARKLIEEATEPPTRPKLWDALVATGVVKDTPTTRNGFRAVYRHARDRGELPDLLAARPGPRPQPSVAKALRLLAAGDTTPSRLELWEQLLEAGAVDADSYSAFRQAWTARPSRAGCPCCPRPTSGRPPAASGVPTPAHATPRRSSTPA